MFLFFFRLITGSRDKHLSYSFYLFIYLTTQKLFSCVPKKQKKLYFIVRHKGGSRGV